MGFPQENMDSQSSSLTSAGLCAQLLSCVQLFVTPPRPWTADHQAPLSLGFPRQGFWSRLPFPSPGDLPDPGIEPMSPASPALAGRFSTTEPLGEPLTSADLLFFLKQCQNQVCEAVHPLLIQLI